MKIYIDGGLVRSEILPSNTPTRDETLETFSFALISNDIALPFAPMQEVVIDFLGDNTNLAYFYLVSDSVETYSLNPLKYKHNITCIQNTRALSKHLVRNSVFSQPAYLYKKSHNALSRGAYSTGSSGGPAAWQNAYISPTDPNLKSEPLHLTNKEKIKSASFKMSFQFGYGQYAIYNADMSIDAHNKNDILALATDMTSITISDTLTLRYKDANNQTQTEAITPATFGLTEFDLNGTYNFPRIVELANQGCNDFEMLFDTLLFLDGTYTTDNIRVLFWFTQLEIKAETYYWTCYDILDLLIKRQQKEDDIISHAPLFSLPQSGDLYDLLTNTIAPNFTFTQLTMYECVAEVFRLFDAIFTMDENGVLGIEYFNDLSGDYVSDNKFTGRTLALGEDKYTNGLVAHYQDARIEESFPREEGKFANLRSAEFGVPEEQDHNFIVPHDIQNIIKFEVLLEGIDVKFSADLGSSWRGDISLSLDITDFVFDESVWSLLDTGALSDSDYDSYNVKQADALYFTRGDNKIKVAATFKDSWNITYYTLNEIVKMAILKLAGVYTVISSSKSKDAFSPSSSVYQGDWKNIKMRITYITTIDGKTETHSLTNKYDGETLIDQNNGAVDLNKMGLNMLGLTLKLGNPTLNATHKITRWEDRIRTGQLYEYQGALWVANVVNYTFFNGFIQGKVSFVQNFNALALRTQLLREKRMTNISKELVQKSEEIITDFVYFSSEPITPGGEEIHFNPKYLKTFIEDSFGIAGPYSKVYDSVLYYPNVLHGAIGVYIPMARYGAGNTINFEMSFEHPMNAGNRTLVTTNWLGSNKYFTTHVIYADTEDSTSYGFMDEANVKTPVYDITYDSNFPIVQIYPENDPQEKGEGFFDIRGFKVYKQPNEVFALNYQIAFLPLETRENIDFIGNEWVNNNCFVRNFDDKERTLYIAFKSEKSSNLDVKATPYFLKKEIQSVGSSGHNYKFSVDFTFEALTSAQKSQVESWAIIDDRDNVLFASNNINLDFNGSVSIYFISRKNRILLY